jgi:protein tyrosine/serine phosphatase
MRHIQILSPAASARRPRRALLLSTALALYPLVPLGVHVWYVALGSNFYTVIPGQVYRSAQPSPTDLLHLVQAYDIRTVINLRGECDEAWYYEEHARARELGVDVVDVGLWARAAPPPDQLRLLVEAIARSPGAVLVHCHSGGDRSGLAAALALLLRTDGTVADARRQLSVFYGHNPFGSGTAMDQVLDRYEAWLAVRGQAHCPECLRQWANRQEGDEHASD